MSAAKTKSPQPSIKQSDKDSHPRKPAHADIASLEKLLITVAELMKRAPGLDHQAFEYLRRLRVAVRFAKSTPSTLDYGLPPREAPIRWLERRDRNESPVDFIRREYAPWLENKVLSKADIRKVDQSLYAALYHWIAKHGEAVLDIDLPTKKQAIDRKLLGMGKIKPPRRLLKVSELSPEDREKLRLYRLAEQRKNRQID